MLRTTSSSIFQASRNFSVVGVCPKHVPQHKPLLRLSGRVLTPRIRASAEAGAIDANVLLAGSAIASITVPSIWAMLRAKKVEKISPKEAALMLDENCLLVDTRTEKQILAEGAPDFGKRDAELRLHAPWNLYVDGRLVRNPHFEDDVLFSPGVQEGTAFIIMSRTGDSGYLAAEAVARLGNNHDVYVMDGGFAAWKFSGLAVDCSTQEDGVCDITDGELSPQSEVVLELDAAHVQPIFRPKLMDTIMSGYSADDLRQDVMAGLVIGVIALSLSMALGIASESTPAVGLTTAVVAGSLISILGGSRVVVGGPTAAFIPIVVGIAHTYGPSGLVVATGLAGLMLVGMGLTGLGAVIKYIPKPVVTGFTAGIATYIFSTQIKDFLGLGVPGHLPAGAVVPPEFLDKVMYLGEHISDAHLPSLGLAAGCLALTLGWPQSWRRVLPPQIVAVVAGAGALMIMDGPLGLHSGIETIGSHFGADAIPKSLPMPHLPAGFNPADVPELIKPAFTIALLAAIESLLCARVSDGMIDDRHNSNTELIAQGVANIASAAVGGLPATGALARTAASVRAGGRTPVAGIVHAATILTFMVVASPLAAYIPLPSLSAVLVVVALNMGEWHNFKELPGWPEKDAQLFLVAFFLTVLMDVAVAVELGMAAAVLLFVKDVTSSVHVRALPPASPLGGDPPGTLLTSAAGTAFEEALNASSVPSWFTTAGSSIEDGNGGDGRVRGLQPLRVPHNTAYVEVTGSLLFGAGDMLETVVEGLHAREPVDCVVLSMAHVSSVDVSGLEVLQEQHKRLTKAGKGLVLCGLTRQPLRMLSRAGFLDEVGRVNVCRGVEEAFERAAKWVAEHKGRSSNGSTNRRLVAVGSERGRTLERKELGRSRSPSPPTIVSA